ncbi:hypothetical protein GCM10023321_31880 [Pseudonocardia eucalypti]|uniref:SDR family NAD(P)-dependent oxidoreductase n=1 Tax=Pseudonocardia eucalypti TaxID=648755 RepID=A0ABP9Q3I8_9PSEU
MCASLIPSASITAAPPNAAAVRVTHFSAAINTYAAAKITIAAIAEELSTHSAFRSAPHACVIDSPTRLPGTPAAHRTGGCLGAAGQGLAAHARTPGSAGQDCREPSQARRCTGVMRDLRRWQRGYTRCEPLATFR